MSKVALTVPAAEANRSFSKLLRVARDGGRVTITAYGQPVAELIPAGADGLEASETQRRRDVLDDLEAHWAASAPIAVGAWVRDDLYERD